MNLKHETRHDMERSEEKELLERCLSGDTGAYEGIVRENERPLFGMMYALTGDVEESRDLVQETFIRVYRKLDTYDTAFPFRNWLFAIGRNIYRDRMRRKKASTSLDALLEDGPFTLREESAETDSEAIRNETRRRVWAALHRLESGQREVLVLKDIEELSYEEIASMLNVPEGTIASRVYYARRALRDLLIEDEGVDRTTVPSRGFLRTAAAF